MPPAISNIQGLELPSLNPTVSLDFSLNRGGFTCGQILKHSEEEWTGKTTLVFEAIAESQKKGVYVYIDSEQALDDFFFGIQIP